MRLGSLFSGIGGFDLAARWLGWETIWYSEVDPYCCAVMAKHFPEAKSLGDITHIDWSTVERPDILCGGFPCQDISNAGKRAGIQGERSSLWFEFTRAIRSLRPRYVAVENVAALLGRGMDVVLGDLSSLGYDAEWQVLSAADVGAPHLRRRIWIVANAQGITERSGLREGQSPQVGRGRLGDSGSAVAHANEGGQPRRGEPDAWRGTIDGPQRDGWWATEPDVGRVVARLSPRVDGGRLDGTTKEGGTGEILRALRHPDGARQLQWPARGFGGIQAPEVLLAQLCEYAGAPKPLGNVSLASPETSGVVVRGVWFDGKAACPSCRRATGEQRAREHPDTLSLLSRLLTCDCGAAWLDPTGTPSTSPRVQRLRALGNAVVPQCALEIFKAIAESEGVA